MKNRLKKINPFILLIGSMFLILFLSQEEHNKGKDELKDIRRIVSLSPAITRQIVDLDSEDLLVGVTSYHPPLKRDVQITGSKDQPNIETILSLKPDIVFSSKEDSSTQNIERLEYSGIRTYTFDWNSDLEAIFANFIDLARIIGKEDLAYQKVKEYRAKVDRYRVSSRSCKAAFFVAHDPLVTTSNASFIGRAIEDAGGENVFGNLEVPYPKLSVEHLIAMNPDVIISMMPDADNFFNDLLGDFDYMGVIRFKNIYSITPDKICYYDPKDYVESVMIISDIIKKAVRKINEK